MKYNSEKIKVWFWVAVFAAAALLLGLFLSIAMELKMWSIVFALFSFLADIHAGAVGVFYIAEREVAKLDAELYEGAEK